MDQGWIKLRHIRGNMLGPFPGSGIALRGRHRAPKWLKKIINGQAQAHKQARWLQTGGKGWIKLGYNWGKVLQPFLESVMATMVHKGHKKAKKAKEAIKRPKGSFEPYGAPRWPFQTLEMVPTHRPVCAPT